MAQTNLTSILDKPYKEPEAPKPLPPGTYGTQIVGMPRFDVNKNGNAFFEIQHKLINAGEDVDEEALTEALTSADGEVRSLSEIILKNNYFYESAAWRVDQLLKDCGFEVDGTTSRRECLEGLPGLTVGISIIHKPRQDGKGIFATIERTVALAD